MKISLAWLFDHIDADLKKVNIEDLIDQFNKITAEIEGFEKISIDLSHFSLAQINDISDDGVHVVSNEWGKEYLLPLRDDACLGKYYVIKRAGQDLAWASPADWSSTKDGLIPAVYCDEKDCSGYWKDSFEVQDYILEVDNKSITHRPDMWCHRGFAREIAAILKLPFKNVDDFLEKKEIKQVAGDKFSATSDNQIALEVKNEDVCKRFAGLYISDIEQRPSIVWMVSRLLRVDARSIDAIVDITNYVMLDISQPMHAYDAKKLTTRKIESRFAHAEKLVLLDGQEIELTDQDYVITDGQKPVALAGVMGGVSTAVDEHTKSLFIESACFDAATVRRSAFRHKVRTEASMRFEKTLDPDQNTLAIMRFLRLLSDAHIAHVAADEIISIGKLTKPVEIVVSHEFIEKRLGATISSEFIVKILGRLGFEVSEKDSEYKVHIPSFRASKDVYCKEDIVEEVGRFFGYTVIPYQLPRREMKPFSMDSVMKVRSIKELMAYSLCMREVCNYAFFDEAFLRRIDWGYVVDGVHDSRHVKNPVSGNLKQLVTTLIPGLLKNIEDNAADHGSLRFFEWARHWEKESAKESQVLAGIFYKKDGVFDFYDMKNELMRLFAMLKIPVRWQPDEAPECPWYKPFQTARLLINERVIGVAGKVDNLFFNNIVDGDAFIFEIDGDALLEFKPEISSFNQLSKFPSIERDISIFVPLEISVGVLEDLIQKSHSFIKDVELVDMFEKPEWEGKKSLTFRFVISDKTKTLSSDEVDSIWGCVSEALVKKGAQVR